MAPGYSKLCMALAAIALMTGAARAEPALWVVKGKAATVYLFGTVHVLKAGADWKSPKIRKALDEAHDLTLEVANVDDTAALIPLMRTYGFDPVHPLSAKLDPDTRTKLDAAEKTYAMPAERVDNLRPWCAGLLFSVIPLSRAGYSPTSGVELDLMTGARARGEPILSFETLEQQVRYFADWPEDQQIRFLRETLDDAPRIVDEMDAVEKAWEAGDDAKIDTVVNGAIRAEDMGLYQMLVVKRNEGFANQIAHKLEGTGVSFVAVGAAHLAGADSVQIQLEKRGFKVERY